jgi:hypothetical protein
MGPRMGMPGMGMMGGMTGMGGMMGEAPPSSLVSQIPRGDAPPLLMVRSGANDRITMIDTATQKKATFRMPKDAVTEMMPMAGTHLVTLSMKGPAITRTAVFDIKEFRWIEHDLKDPITSISEMSDGGGALLAFTVEAPRISRITVFDRAEKAWSDFDLKEPAEGQIQATVLAGTARYVAGRFLYVYSVQAKKWSFLERPQAPSNPLERSMLLGLTNPQGMGSPIGNGEITIADAEIVHIYDPKTGDWTHISTKDDQ